MGATLLWTDCPECNASESLVRDDEDGVVTCPECGVELLPDDPDYPEEV